MRTSLKQAAPQGPSDQCSWGRGRLLSARNPPDIPEAGKDPSSQPGPLTHSGVSTRFPPCPSSPHQCGPGLGHPLHLYPKAT